MGKGSYHWGNYAKMGLVANVNDLSAATDLVKDGAVARNGEEGEKSLGETWMEKKNAGLYGRGTSPGSILHE